MEQCRPWKSLAFQRFDPQLMLRRVHECELWSGRNILTAWKNRFTRFQSRSCNPHGAERYSSNCRGTDIRTSNNSRIIAEWISTPRRATEQIRFLWCVLRGEAEQSGAKRSGVDIRHFEHSQGLSWRRHSPPTNVSQRCGLTSRIVTISLDLLHP